MSKDPREWPRVKWDQTKQLPCKPGCYALLDKDDNILYIGRSKVLWKRLSNPRRHPGFNRKSVPEDGLSIAWSCGWEVYDLESELISMWNPPLCHPQHGVLYRWINNGSVSRKLWDGLPLPEGWKEGHKSRRPVELTRIDEVFVFDCVTDAARALGISSGSVSSVCRGKDKTCKGFTARYLT